MIVSCEATPCPVILSATCVFYEGENLIYTGINTNDNLQTALAKIDAKFQDAGLGYIFENGIIQLSPGQPVRLGGSLMQDTTINSAGYTFALSGTFEASALITTGGTANDFVKGDGSLDSTSYQPAGSYITGLTGDGTASGPGNVPLTLATVNANPGTYGDSITVPRVTVNAKGLVTNITPVSISLPADTIILVGDVSAVGTTGAPITTTLATVNSNVYGSNTFLKFAVNAKGLVTSAAPVTQGDLISVLGFTPVPDSRTLTINGLTKDLTADRSWSVGTVTSVQVAVPPAFSVTTAPITSFGTINIAATGNTSQYIRGDGALAPLPFTTSGSAGTSGTSGIDGTSGTNGTSGTSGSSGSSGVTGLSGSSGTSGIDGTSGTSGTSGLDGSSGSSGTSGVGTVSGTLNYVAKFTPNTTTVGDSQVYDNGTNVMINTTTPSTDYPNARLVVNQSVGNSYLEVRSGGSQSSLILSTATAASSNFPTLEIFNSANFGIVGYRPGIVSSNYMIYYALSSSTNRYLSFQTEGVDRIRINQNGNTIVGGTVDAGYKLDVQGTLRATGNLTISNAGLYVTSPSGYSGGAIEVQNNMVGASTIQIKRADITNAQGVLQFSDLKTGANSRAFSIGIGRSGDPQWTNGDFIFAFYKGSGGWEQNAKIFNATGNWAIENGTATSDIVSALFQVNSTTKGFLPPRMTETQKNAISTPATGLVIYQTDGSEGLYQNTSAGWVAVGSGAAGGGASALFNYYNFI